MVRVRVDLSISSDLPHEPSTLRASPGVLKSLGTPGGFQLLLGYGIRRCRVKCRPDRGLSGRLLLVPELVAAHLRIAPNLNLTLYRPDRESVRLGPLVGVLLSRAKLRAVLEGEQDSIYQRFVAYAREAGGALVFCTVDGFDEGQGELTGYRLHEGAPGRWNWVPGRFPVPRVLYDRCFGAEGREEALTVRALSRRLEFTVINTPVKITKLEAFDALRGTDLEPHLPQTVPLTADSLKQAMRTRADLYLKPNALYKGKGVCRLTRASGGWILHTPTEQAVDRRELRTGADVTEALEELLASGQEYVLQEGLPLAAYLGNRFDLRSLVQKDGSGKWRVTGVSVRIAPADGVVTSPRSGGNVAPLERVLAHVFPSGWREVQEEVERVSLAMAAAMERAMGPCVELGLDLGVLQDGRVALIEVNGKPLKVSLQRLRDPLITERIFRCPIQYAIRLDLTGRASRTPLDRSRRTLCPSDSDRLPPLVAVLLQRAAPEFLRQKPRYQEIALEAKRAGCRPIFLDISGLDLESGSATGLVWGAGEWHSVTVPLPEVIYHRTAFRNPLVRAEAAQRLRRLTAEHGVILLNSVNAFSKWQTDQALRFFRETADLAPETVLLQGPESLEHMLETFPVLVAKADHGSHGSDVLRITAGSGGWHVRGKAGGRPVETRFERKEQLCQFLALLSCGSNWVVQQGICLPEVDGRFFDLRVVLQKDGAGQWQTALVLLRLAQPNRVAANMSQGAEPFLPEEFLRLHGHRFPGLTQMAERAAAVAHLTALALEARFGRLGEIGVDIGVDETGRAWVFEANTKPLHPELPGLPVPLIRHPFQYAAFLARAGRLGRRTRLPPPV
jgi:hypothetical protein